MTSNEAKEIAKHLNEMTSILFELADKIPEGEYLKMMNASKDIFKMAEQMEFTNSILRERVAALASVAPISVAYCATGEVIGRITRLGHQSEEILREDLRNTRKVDLIMICRSLRISYAYLNKENLINKIVNRMNTPLTAATEE
jgi:hypothetical protein